MNQDTNTRQYVGINSNKANTKVIDEEYFSSIWKLSEPGNPFPYQIEAVYKFLLPLPKIRFLLADDTGTGKTIMTGLLIKELLMRGGIERILIITPGGLTKQWQEDELGLKFNLPFKLVNRAAFQSDPAIFMTSDRLITSIDFLRSEDVLNIVKETSWDIIIVDEALKCLEIFP